MRASKLPSKPRLYRASGAFILSLLLAAAGGLIISSAAEAKPVDTTPPTFTGLNSAITCIPGPIGGGRTASYNLSWNPANDDRTPTKKIVYDIYQAETSGGQDFSTPTYTSSAGATSFTTPPLSADKQFFFVVRARDQAGNSDSNKVEREGQNLCV